MFIETDSTIVSQLAEEFSLDVYEKAMLTSCLKLDSWQREFIRKWVKDALREVLSDESARQELLSDQETSAAPVAAQERKQSVQTFPNPGKSAPAAPAKTPDEMTLDEMKALLELQFNQEKKGVDAS